MRDMIAAGALPSRSRKTAGVDGRKQHRHGFKTIHNYLPENGNIFLNIANS